VCGCGSDDYFIFLLELLQDAHNEKKDFKKWENAPWFEFGAKILDKFGLTGHGGSVGSQSLTETGKILFEFLTDFGIRLHPDWAESIEWEGEFEGEADYDRWIDCGVDLRDY